MFLKIFGENSMTKLKKKKTKSSWHGWKRWKKEKKKVKSSLCAYRAMGQQQIPIYIIAYSNVSSLKIKILVQMLTRSTGKVIYYYYK